MTYEELKAKLLEMRDAGELDKWPTREQRIDWAYGNAKLSNPEVTREMVEYALEGPAWQDAKTTDWCAVCGHSPESGVHPFDHLWVWRGP